MADSSTGGPELRERVAQFFVEHAEEIVSDLCPGDGESDIVLVVEDVLPLADAVLAALGLEQVGDGWCSTHGTARCPEQYMLNAAGTPIHGYRNVWREDIRCGRRVPVYRLTAQEDR